MIYPNTKLTSYVFYTYIDSRRHYRVNNVKMRISFYISICYILSFINRQIYIKLQYKHLRAFGQNRLKKSYITSVCWKLYTCTSTKLCSFSSLQITFHVYTYKQNYDKLADFANHKGFTMQFCSKKALK